MKKLIMLLILLMTVVNAKEYLDRTTDSKSIEWMLKGEKVIKSKLKDPTSAKFKDVYFSRSGGVPMTCGYVNSKNSLGGYVGYQKFISAGKPDLSFLEEQVSDFDTIWYKFCQ